MGKVAVEHIFQGTTAAYADYNQDKTILGPLIIQHTGASATDKWAGPTPIGLARAFENGNPIAGLAYPHVLSISSTTDWVFLADVTAAATTRKVYLYEYNRGTQTFTWKGLITLTYPTTGAETIRGFRACRYLYTTGTVGVSGTAVSGSGTGWQTARFAVGARIGFGSTDPTQITSWYYISAIASDVSITLSASAGTVAAGTAFVIEELRFVTLTTNGTAGNGGLYLTKGVNVDDFSSTGATIPAAISTDNVKAVYWLKDAGTCTLTIGAGVALPDAVSNTDHSIYCLHIPTATTLTVYKFNMRAALTVATGASTDAFVVKTAASAAVTGNISQTNNGRYAETQHGPGQGVPSIYFVTASRVYRIQCSLVYDANASFITDGMQEIPTGSANTIPASGALSSIEYSSTADSFVITTNATNRQWMTKYQTNADPFDTPWGCEDRQIDQSSADSGITPHPSFAATAFSVFVEAGMLYVCRNGTTATNLHVYAVPLAAHWDFAESTNNRLITPRLPTPNAAALYRAYVCPQEVLGSDTLGTSPEPYRLYARTTGISDNSGDWVRVPQNGDLSGVALGDWIQLMLEFKVMGLTCVPARIFSVTVLYEDDSADTHYQPSVSNSNVATATFAWRHAVAFGGNVPALRVRLYNAVTDDLLVDDNTDSPNGTFERSTNGGTSWVAWTNADKGNETTYIRYTPASLASNVTVRALLTQN